MKKMWLYTLILIACILLVSIGLPCIMLLQHKSYIRAVSPELKQLADKLSNQFTAGSVKLTPVPNFCDQITMDLVRKKQLRATIGEIAIDKDNNFYILIGHPSDPLTGANMIDYAFRISPNKFKDEPIGCAKDEKE